MSENSTVHMKNSIATQLLTAVFSIYLIVAVGVTLVHMVAEYYNEKERLKQDLQVFQSTFEPVLESVLWVVDPSQIRSALIGMLKVPIIVGVKIIDYNQNETNLGAMGLIKDQQGNRIHVKHPSTEPNFDFVTQEREGFLELIEYSFPIFYHDPVNNRKYELAKVTLYSSQELVFQQVKYGFIFIIINSIIKTISLWVIFLWMSRLLLRNPLSVLISATEQIKLDALEQLSIDVKTSGRNELKVFEETIKRMVQKLLQARKNLEETLKSLSLSNKRHEILLDCSKDIAVANDKFTLMTVATNALLKVIQCKPSASVRLSFQENEIGVGKGYSNFRVPIDISDSAGTVIRLNKLGQIEHYFLPGTESMEHILMEDGGSNGCWVSEEILFVPAWHEGVLAGIIEVNGVEPIFFKPEDKTFVDTLSQSIALSLEDIRVNFQLRKAKQELETINQDLEKLVEQRTRELQQTLAQLEDKHLQLKQTQARLVQTEKMAGLGTIVAGAAHELNNPNNFVRVGSWHLRKDISSLKEYIFELMGKDGDNELQDSFEFKFGQLHRNLDNVHEGSQRIQTIVQGLRTFARLDEAEFKKINIVESLQSAFVLVKENYQNQVEFIQDYQVNVKLDCWAAELNQAFMNIMLNACQAIVDRQKQTGDTTPGKLTISSFTQDKSLGIRFEDTGCGIPEEIRDKIFEPFFTTREVGKGTGLGLAIVFSTIEKHRGSIAVESTVGKGTMITVCLPLESRTEGDHETN